MKKIILSLVAGTMLATTAMAAEVAETVKPASKADGAYVGLGGGVSFNGVMLSKGDYVTDGTDSYDVTTLSDSSFSYIIYGGYQFNKIIAVEASFTDYGSFSDDVKSKNGLVTRTFSSDPLAGAVYANAGYTFANGVRPFGQLGIGYMQTNQSDTLDHVNNFDDSFMTFHYGIGVEYAPVSLKGFGFRAAYTGDMNADYNAVAYDDNGNLDSDAFLMRFYGMLYVGAQYKF